MSAIDTTVGRWARLSRVIFHKVGDNSYKIGMEVLHFKQATHKVDRQYGGWSSTKYYDEGDLNH